MANTFQERAFRLLGSSWHRLPPSYRAPVILTSCAALLMTSLAWKKLTYTPELPPPTPKGYSYRLHLVAKEGSASFILPDGRKIGYAQYGSPNGKPIISLHGILGSRLESALFDADAKALGARIIAIERPGIGLSSPDPRPLRERRVLDHATEVNALAEHLRLGEYAVLGTSGGGPYALACAHSLPSSGPGPNLRAVAIVTGQGLPDMSQAWPTPVVFLNKHLDLRWAMRWIFARSPAWQPHLSDEEKMEGLRQSFDLKKAHPADVGTARRADYPDMVRLFVCSAREAVAQGWEGFLDETRVLSSDPGFRVEDIRADLPVQLWYGTDDTNVSPKAGEETAQRLRAGGNSKVELHMKQGETHGSTQVKYRKDVLKDLLRAMEP
jgi:pimeloyl-ACP methyl ester carboxylesterase